MITAYKFATPGQSALRTGYGVGVFLSGNDSAWDSPTDTLTAMGLQVITQEL